VVERVAELSSILATGEGRRARIDLRALRKQATVPPLDLGDLAEPAPEPDWWHFAPRPSVLDRLLPGGARRHEQRAAEARVRFDQAVRQHQESEAERHRKITALRGKHDDDRRWLERNVAEHNKTVDDLVRGLPRREHRAVEAYLREVLASTPLPEKFPRHNEVTFNSKAEQAVVRVELPLRDVVPEVRGYQYVQTKDEERPLPRPAKEVRELYRSVISQVALLFVRDLFDADQHLVSVGFNGHVRATNPATGKREFPCLISLDVGRESLK